jgi:hypothetical protein
MISFGLQSAYSLFSVQAKSLVFLQVGSNSENESNNSNATMFDSGH